MATITSANSVLTLSADPIYPTPRTIRGFGVDGAFSADAVEIGGLRIGIDGQSAAYFSYKTYPFHLTLLANSPDIPYFDDCMTQEFIIRDKFTFNGTLLLPSIGRRYILSKGILRSHPVLPEAREYLGDVSYTLEFTRITGETA